MAFSEKQKTNRDQLLRIISDVSFPVAVYFEFNPGKQEFIVINELPSEIVDRFAGAVIRNYVYLVNYYMILEGDPKVKIKEALGRRVDELERALNNSILQTDASSNYVWHDGQVIEMELDAPLEDFEAEIEQLHVGRLLFQITVTEAF